MFSKERKLKVAVLISGRGSNMEAIIRRQNIMPEMEVVCVVSDNPDARGLTIAENFGIEAHYIDPGSYKTKLEGDAEQNYIDYLKSKNTDLICLAGFMRVVKKGLLQAFPRRILNIHPSLLPDYPGLDVHQRVLAAGEKETGCTVHFVTEDVDGGEILGQKKVYILERDNSEKLAKRVLKQEHILYSNIISKIAKNEIRLG